MLKKITSYLLLVFVLLATSSCFDIKEKIYLKRNGSGTYSFVVDMSGMKGLIEMMQSMGDEMSEETESDSSGELAEAEEAEAEFGDEEPDEGSPVGGMSNDFKDKGAELAAIDGINSVEMIDDEENFQFGIQFEFDNLEALNEAMNKIYSKDGEESNKEFISASRKRFSRTAEGDIAQMIREEMNSKGGGSDMQQMGDMFKEMSITTTYTFDRRIKNVSNPNSMISPDGKTVEIRYNMLNDQEDDPGLANEIKF